MPNSLLLSGLQVALAVSVLWRRQAEQWHGPRRIAKHLELSGLLPLPAYKVQSSELSLLCLNNLHVRGAEKDLAAVGAGRNSKIKTKGFKMESKMELRRKQRDPRWNPRWNSEAKGSKMESQMELRRKQRKQRKQRNPRLTPKIESK